MAKVFINQGDNGEKAFRRGVTVPDGAVNVAWAKSPTVNPKNNVIMIDTTNTTGGNRARSAIRKKIAFANPFGILEDINGNQIWDEEYPVISDVFADDEAILNCDFNPQDILPFLHVSRFFHVDFPGLAFDNLEPYIEKSIRVIDRNGNDHLNSEGEKLYKVFLVQASQVTATSTDRDATPYRLYVFLDYNPNAGELFLEYNKVELNKFGVIKNQESDYKETINPRNYYAYQPEESDVIDRMQEELKVYSTKPVSLKEKILDLPRTNRPGWKIYVPRKALPDPRIFQLFNWRIACEFTRNVGTEDPNADKGVVTKPRLKVGVIVDQAGNHASSRANFFFYQIEQSDYNTSNIEFINPLKTNVNTDKTLSAYWQVDINAVTLDQLEEFDILLWAPSTNTTLTPHLPKIKHFTEVVGGTIIFESSSNIQITGLRGVTYGTVLNSSMRVSTDTGNWLDMNTIRFFDATPDVIDDTFANFGMWQDWPPNVADIVNNYNDTGSIIKSASNIAGWDITSAEEDDISPYLDEIGQLSNPKWQKITLNENHGWATILEAQGSDTNYYPVLAHKRFNSGGGIFVSSGCVFEDHMFDSFGTILSKTIGVDSINTFDELTVTEPVAELVDAPLMAAEMKLRVNLLLFASIFKPSDDLAQVSPEVGLQNDGNIQTITVWSDWKTDWVINPDNDVLTQDEIDEYKFVLQPIDSEGTDLKWQKILSNKTIGKIIEERIKKLDPDGTSEIFNSFAGADKRYFIFVTNPLVQVLDVSLTTAEKLPTAWTEAYSPRFEVPANFGPYCVRNELTAATTAQSQGQKVFPARSYAVQTKLGYTNSEGVGESQTATVTIEGSYYQTYTIPTKKDTVTTKIWVPGTESRWVDRIIYWSRNPETKLVQTPFLHQSKALVPKNIFTWSDVNYARTRTNNWPFSGEYGFHSTSINSYGDRVKRIQMFLNQCWFWKVIRRGPFAEDGYYGSQTAAGIREFQQARGAQYIDGIIDAETWSLIGFQFIDFSRLDIPSHNFSWMRDSPREMIDWANRVLYYMRLESISNASTSAPFYIKQSWFRNGPTSIREGFSLGFVPDDMKAALGTSISTYKIYRFDIMPYTISGNSVNLDWLDIRTKASLLSYGYTNGNPGRINLSGGDGAWINVAFNPVQFNIDDNFDVVFRLHQSNPTGRGTSRLMGIRDARIYAKTYFPGTAGYYDTKTTTNVIPGKTYQVKKSFTSQFTYNFKTGEPVIFDPLSMNIGKTIDSDTLADITLTADNISDILWDESSISFDVDDTDFEVTFSDKNYGNESEARVVKKVEITYNGGALNVSNVYYTYGPKLGAGGESYRTRTTSVDQIMIDPYPKTYGWISKQDGIKLLCDSDGDPVGFPTVLPSALSATTGNDTHFASYRLFSFDTDQTVFYGFYDIAQKEFITNRYGESEISYYEYIRRGPNNIFIAVMTTFEISTFDNLPHTGESIQRPFSWIMPVYGVTTSFESKIQLQPLSPNLENTDVWPIPIKTGSFAKDISLRPKSEGGLVGILADYQGTTITAHYEIPESNDEVWSSLYGRPYRDIRGETPIVIDDAVIKVRQAPILLVQETTTTPSLADPWRPVFVVYARDNLTSDWVRIPHSQIKDYNIWTGEITLKFNLPSNDPRLVKVDYTTQSRVYNLKHTGVDKVNLNPYINFKPEWQNVPLYVYISPAYITDNNYSVIPNSVKTRTINITTSPDIFNAAKVNYDPSALLIGIVYISTAMDLNDLVMLDTRRRGGGATLKLTDLELVRDNPEIMDYADVVPPDAVNYQSGGFVIIRLPSSLANNYSENQIRQIIERNITAGVRFKLEDLNGKDWAAVDPDPLP